MSEFRRACAEKAFEIDQQAAEYVRNGVPPWEAYEKAVRVVQQRSLRFVTLEDLIMTVTSESCR